MKACKNGRISIRARAHAAELSLEDHRPDKAILYLEDYFSSDSFKETGPDAAYALSMLMDAYLELDEETEKRKLVDRIVNFTPVSPLRSEAWQRLSTIRMDDGDSDGSWQAFKNAQRDDHAAPGLRLLEVQLLMAENKFQQAGERARFFVKQLERMGMTDEEYPMLAFLRDIAEDPQQAHMALEFDMADNLGQELVQWVKEVKNRPLPNYSLEELEADEPEDELHVSMIKTGSYAVIPPANLIDIEDKWFDECPLDKPFSINPHPNLDVYPWDPEEDFGWIDFLSHNPKAFDSLYILDDLIELLSLHPNWGAPGFNSAVYEPVMDRALSIIDHILEFVAEGYLPWLVDANRPLLRTLVRHAFDFEDNDEDDRMMATFERLLRVNPDDNHGFRTGLINHYLQADLDQEALKLALSYPNDIFPDIVFGKVLALYKLDRKEEATMAAQNAVEEFPKVVKYLTASRVKEPELDQFGLTMAGEDQAWMYREEMRDTWKASRGALSWLERINGRAIRNPTGF